MARMRTVKERDEPPRKREPRAVVKQVDGVQQGPGPGDDDASHDSVIDAWEAYALDFIASFTPAPGELSKVTKVPLIYQWDAEVEGTDTESFSQVAVVVRDSANRCLMLRRDGESAAAQTRKDGSTIALPSLRTTDELQGKFKAQHAVNLLFGPMRAYPEFDLAWQSLRLCGAVRATGASTEVVGIYQLTVDAFDQKLLERVFAHRRCTPTHAALYPSFEVCEAGEVLDKCNTVDGLVLQHVFGLESPETLAPFQAEAPPVPRHKEQGDATEGMRPSRRKRNLAPGEHPAAMDQSDDMTAEYDDFVPRVADPLAFIKELIPTETAVTAEELSAAQAEDETCQRLKLWMQTQVPDRVEPHLREEQTMARLSSIKKIGGILYLLDKNGQESSSGQTHLRCIIPESMRLAFTRLMHVSTGHPGIKATLRLVAARAWWPSMKKTVVEVVSPCPTCLLNNEVAYRGAQHIPNNGSHPWHSWCLDAVHLHEAKSGRSKALVFYDRFSRDVEAFAVMADFDTDVTLSIILFEMVPRHGWPRVLYVDRGSNFISKQARAWFKAVGIDLRPADAHMHTAVAGCERFNKTLRKLARAAHFDTGFEWDVMLPLLVYWYKQLVHASTGKSTFYLNHGRDAVSPWDLRNGPKPLPTTVDNYTRQQLTALHIAWMFVREDLKDREDKQKEQHDKKYQTNVKFEVNERVLIRQAGRISKMRMPYVGPFRIVEVLDRDRYRVEGRRGARKDHHEFHVSKLKLWPKGADANELYRQEGYFDAECVVDSRVRDDGQREYRVRWAGFATSDDSWLLIDDMNAAMQQEAFAWIREHLSTDTDDDEGFDDSDDVGAEDERVGTDGDYSDNDDTAAAELTDDEGAGEELRQPTPSAKSRDQRLADRQVRMGPVPEQEGHIPRAVRELQD